MITPNVENIFTLDVVERYADKNNADFTGKIEYIFPGKTKIGVITNGNEIEQVSFKLLHLISIHQIKEFKLWFTDREEYKEFEHTFKHIDLIKTY